MVKTNRTVWGLTAMLAAAVLGGIGLLGVGLRPYWVARYRGPGADLPRALLIWAPLGDADLDGANLQSADLAGANLADASLEDVNLQSASLPSANLADASLYEADLQSANLAGANLCGAMLVGRT
jgi:uncharacterized protein YjbI with pentapeptide repeats